jgi:hypothetical protein
MIQNTKLNIQAFLVGVPINIVIDYPIIYLTIYIKQFINI